MRRYIVPRMGLWHNSSALEKFKIFGAVAATFLFVPLTYVLVVRGPLWPIARLMLLNDTNDKLEHEGFNARMQQVLCLAALGFLVLSGFAGGLGWYHNASELWAVAAFSAFVYGAITIANIRHE